VVDALKPFILRVAERVLDLAEKADVLGRLRIDDYCVCLSSAYVVVKDCEGRRALGMAHIPRIELHRLGEVQPPAIEALPEIVVSINPIARVLGVALLNAVSQYLLHPELKQARRQCKNLILETAKHEGEPVCIIGSLTPLARALKEEGVKVWVFEKDPLLRCPDCMSDAEELYLGPSCKTMFITGMTLLNWSIDYLINMKGPYKMLIGPTAGILPHALQGEPINAISSFHPEKIDELREHLRLGGYITGPDQPQYGIPYIYYVDSGELLASCH
jgi:uncharacterized protein (DUF4213/DUF364 family)